MEVNVIKQWTPFLSITNDRMIEHAQVDGADYYRFIFKGKHIHVFAALEIAIEQAKDYRDNVLYVKFGKDRAAWSLKLVKYTYIFQVWRGIPF